MIYVSEDKQSRNHCQALYLDILRAISKELGYDNVDDKDFIIQGRIRPFVALKSISNRIG